LGEKLAQGLIQVYTGNGKGKSTAAFGLAMRAIGQGLRVQIVQFMKSGAYYGEITTIKKLSPDIEVRSFGREGFIKRGNARPEDYALAQEALDFAEEIMLAGERDILILDDINNAVYFELLSVERVLELLKQKPPNVELILTGRNAVVEIIEVAHLVTECREIKHPYQLGIGSRLGIEY
jgi:cob(I)alamin adenosyltransferase